MPFKSEKQRKFLHAKHPKIAERWEKEQKRYSGVAKTRGRAKARS